MSKILCAVIGVGYLGRFHAQKYQNLPNAKLVALCDINPNLRESITQEFNVPFYTDYRDLFNNVNNKVNTVSIATTTNKHYAIAKDCLEHGLNVLIEKPIVETSSQAEELIQLAKKNKLKLQVGHLERFNSVHLALEPYINSPLFIESSRLAPFTPRGSDVNVILDLMIHDIDLIQSIVKSPIATIEAQGAPVLTKAIDIANARLKFANNCVANITASRISFKTERKTKIFQADSYISLDYHTKQLAIFKKSQDEIFPGVAGIIKEQREVPAGDALLEEIKSFLQCIENDTDPIVSGEDGKNALTIAEQITALINLNLTKHYAK